VDKQELDRRYTVILLIWASLLGGVVLFAGIAWALGGGLLGEPWETSLPSTVALPMLGLSVVLMVAGIVLRRARWGPREAADPFLAFQQRTIVAWAVQEGGGLLGICLSLVAGRPAWILAMGALAAFALLLTRPGRDELGRIEGG